MNELSPTTLTLADLPSPKGLPLLGNIHQIDTTRLHLGLERWAEIHGDRYTFGMGPQRVLYLAHPQVVNDVLKRRPGDFRRYKKLADALASVGVDGVFSAEGDRWRHQRKLVNGALHIRHMPAFFPTVARVTNQLRERWMERTAAGQAIDIAADLRCLTVDITTSLALGVELNTVGGDKSWLRGLLEPILPEAMARSTAVVPLWQWWKSPHQRRFHEGIDRLNAWITELITTTRADMAGREDSTPVNLFESLIAEADTSDDITDDDVRANAITMMIAGEDTTAITLTWAIHELLQVPEAMARLAEEADGMAGNVAASLEEARSLTWAGAVTVETLRLRPPGPILFLETLADTTIEDLAVPAGTVMMVNARAGANSTEWVDQADQFQPERWLDPAFQKQARRDGLNLPFGSGARLCPGRALALLEIQVVLSMIARSFKIERVGSASDVQESFKFTMDPEGLQVRLHQRKGAAPRTNEQADVPVTA